MYHSPFERTPALNSTKTGMNVKNTAAYSFSQDEMDKPCAKGAPRRFLFVFVTAMLGTIPPGLLVHTGIGSISGST